MAVAALKPDIVYSRRHRFWPDGPHRDKPAFDDIIQAACGFVGAASGDGAAAGLHAEPDRGQDHGLAVANAVLAALFHRERHGTGSTWRCRCWRP